MTEYPIFAPSGDKRIAAVVTLPETSPIGVVVFTTGAGGALRSQRYRLWTRAARALAERGIASVRMEFAGVGDSTGSALIGMGFEDLPVDDMREVAELAMKVTGTRRLGLCGNCAGARTSLKVAASLPTCEAMVLFWLKPLAHTVTSRSTIGRLGGLLQGLPRPIRRLPAHAYFRLHQRSRRASHVGRALATAARSTDILLMETRSKLAGDLPRVVRGLQAAGLGHRVELRGIDSTSMQAFQSLADQVEAVDAVADWFTRVFATGGAERVREAVI
jgi:pimeloyl-ACP methyl ester carboxylesterase